MYLLMKAKVTHGIDLNHDRLKKIMKRKICHLVFQTFARASLPALLT